MYKASIIMLRPELAQRIGALMREKNEDEYILYRILLETGEIAKNISRMKVREMRGFIVKYKDFIPDDLKETIARHMEYLNDDEYFFAAHRSKNHWSPLSKRTYECFIQDIGYSFGIDGLGVKTISRSFFYSYLRQHGYDFTALRSFPRSKARCFTNLKSFLEYCDITEEEYRKDMARYLNQDIDTLNAHIDDSIHMLEERKSDLSDGKCSYETIVDTIRVVDLIQTL